MQSKSGQEAHIRQSIVGDGVLDPQSFNVRVLWVFCFTWRKRGRQRVSQPEMRDTPRKKSEGANP